jgi:pectinesterase
MRAWALLLLASLAQAQPRPQLTAEQAAAHTVTAYLDGWQFPPLADLGSAAPDFVVAPGASVQAAIDAVPAAGSTSRRWVIQIQPGIHREAVCIRDKAPLTLIGSPLDPASVVIVEGRYNALPKPAGQPAHPCQPELGATTHGTAGSSSMMVFSDDVQLAHLTIANDAMDRVHHGEGYPGGAGESGGAQAVALTLAGDRIQLEGVRLLGHQDTLYARQREPGKPARVLVRHSLIAGDVDFIFGNATLVVQHCTVLSRAGRRAPGQGGIVIAPSTAADQGHGFLFSGARFVGEPGLAPGSVALGRAWDAGVKPGTWQAGTSPNGQALVRDSQLGAHLGPWAASTSRRPFDPASNRLAEFHNSP